MKVIGEFNKVSEEIKKRIKPVKKGQQVHYRLLTGVWDMVSGETRYGSSTTIVLFDQIQDGDRIVDIGVSREVKPDGTILPKKFYVSPTGDNILHNGVFTLHAGDRLDDREIYEFFEICNDNGSNPERDKSKPAKFERIDEVKEADKVTSEVDTLTAALVHVSQMKAADFKEFAQIMNWNVNEDPAVLKSRVKRYAKDEPEDFLSKVDDPENSVKVVIKKALDLGVISYLPEGHKILWATGQVLAKLERAEPGEDPALDCFHRWIKEKSNGENVLKSIKLSLRKKAGEEVEEE